MQHLDAGRSRGAEAAQLEQGRSVGGHDVAVIARSRTGDAGAQVGVEHRGSALDRRPACRRRCSAPKSSTWIAVHTRITSGTSCSTSSTPMPLGRELAEQLAEASRSRRRRGPRPARRAAAPGAGWRAPGRARPGGPGPWAARRPARRRRRRGRRARAARRPRRGRARPVRGPTTAAELGRDEHVLAGGQRAEHLEPLEGAGDAQPRPLVRLRR